MGVGITPNKTMGIHYGLYVVIELLLGFANHGNALMGLQHNEYEV
jgi:hypothetical protein